LNLHYPASDIPIQARQLYSKNPIRVIKDVNYTPIGIMANSDEAIDMGMSFLRSVSPIHLQYMKNMGVHASMTISIIIEGKLWGLIACHHQSPYLPETKTVYTCEKISHVISSLINMFQQQNSQKRKAKFLATIDTITSLLKSNIHTYNISAFIRQNLSMFLPLFNANGLIVYSDDTIESINIELDNYKINKLTNNIISLLKENTFITTSLATHLKLEEDILTTCAGIVAIKIEEFDTVFIFTRVQQVQTIEWGGDPTKPAQDLTPRTSFEKFSQTVTQKSLPWSETIETKLDIFREKLREIFILQSSQQTIKVQQNVISTLEKEKTKNQAQLIDMLIAMIEQRDAYTAGHTQRVAQFCTLIASHLGCTQSEIEMLDQAAKLHDLGKISIPDSVLLKPGRLSNNEYGLIKMHLDVGYEILNKIDYYKEIAHIMCHHHEKYDGTGYPSGKKAEEIPLLGHIMIVADALDAMTTNRVYQARKTVDEALKEIEYLSGKWYHPKVVDAIKHLHIAGKITASFASQMPLTQIEQERFSYFFKDQLTSFFNESYLWMILNKSIPNKNIEHFAMVEIHGMTNYNKTHGWLMGSQLINSVAKQINNIHQGSNKFRVFGDDFVLGFISKEKKRAFVSLWQEVKFKNIHTSTKEVQKNDLIAKIQMIL
ncbi:MAG: HD domain-containing phosphohydrolase, partial [Campylobacterales bacterium]